MSKKLYILTFLVILACCFGAFTVVSLNQKYEDEIQTTVTDDMPTFPSYDWDAEDHVMLAYVIANTPGSERYKQEAAISVLDYVWKNSIGITEYVERHYELYFEPTQRDFELVDMIIHKEWASDE